MNSLNAQRKTRRFLVGGVEVRYVPDPKGMHLECTACEVRRCEHTIKVSAWITILYAISPAEDAAELRGRIVAMLRHDYRNSLGAVLQAARVTEITENDAMAAEMATLTERSGAGISEPGRPLDLTDRILKVIQRVQADRTDQVILSDIAVSGPVTCSPRRIEELLTNLIWSAMTNEFTTGTVIVKAYRTERELTISVSNAGPVMTRERCEEEVFRGIGAGDGSGSRHRALPRIEICSEIARANGGELVVSWDDAQPCITFRMAIA
jgi:signal transduction histidine kinase